MQRAVIFDFGGVLMKTVDYMPRHTWDTRLNLPIGSVERAVHNDDSWRKAQTGAIDITEYWQDVGDRLKLNVKQTGQLASDFYSGDALDEAHIDYIKQLREEGFTVGLLSNDSLELAPKLRRLEIDALFDPLVISAQIGVMKPDARAYEAVLRQLNRPAEEVIFIDDRPENVTGANTVGLYGVHYKNGMDLASALAELLYT